MNKLLDSHKADAVREAALAEVIEQGMTHIDWSLLNRVAKRLGSAYEDPQPGAHTWEKNRLQERFAGKVERGLRKAAEEGQIRRSGPKDARPDGSMGDRYVMYWTHAAWKEAEVRHAERQDAARAQALRWDAIEGALEEHTGLVLEGRLGIRQLDPAEWEWLLDRAGWR